MKTGQLIKMLRYGIIQKIKCAKVPALQENREAE